MVRKLAPFESYRQLMELLDKESKFEAMSLKCQENSRKITEIEIVIASLESERNEILEGLGGGSKGKATDRVTERSQQMGEIASEKEQLQREIGVLRGKINDLKESSKVVSEYELLRKNS
jgi:chromosome segregation ATPase